MDEPATNGGVQDGLPCNHAQSLAAKITMLLHTVLAMLEPEGMDGQIAQQAQWALQLVYSLAG